VQKSVRAPYPHAKCSAPLGPWHPAPESAKIDSLWPPVMRYRVHPVAHPPHLSTAAAHPAPEPHGGSPSSGSTTSRPPTWTGLRHRRHWRPTRPRKPARPRKHQREAITKVLKGFESAESRATHHGVRNGKDPHGSLRFSNVKGYTATARSGSLSSFRSVASACVSRRDTCICEQPISCAICV
jgi:hypothetical protein